MFYKIENKELDLLAAYNCKDGPSPFLRIFKLIGIPVGIVVVVAIVCITLLVLNYNVQTDIDQTVTENQSIQKQIDKCDKKAYQELTTLEGTYQSVQQIDEYITSLPIITQNKINGLKRTLLKGMSIQTITYNQKNGQLTVSYISSHVRNIEKYVSAIKENKQYKKVSYKGYQQGSKTTQTFTGEYDPITGQPITAQSVALYYTFSVTITITGGE